MPDLEANSCACTHEVKRLKEREKRYALKNWEVRRIITGTEFQEKKEFQEKTELLENPAELTVLSYFIAPWNIPLHCLLHQQFSFCRLSYSSRKLFFLIRHKQSRNRFLHVQTTNIQLWRSLHLRC